MVDEVATDRLLIDIGVDGRVSVSTWLDGELPGGPVGEATVLDWPLDGEALEDLRWYLEDYLRAPFGVYEDRGPRVEARLPVWGEAIFTALFGAGPARDALVRLRGRGTATEIVVRSASAQWLGLPWELLRDPARPTALALDRVAVSRSMPSAALADTFRVGGNRLRVLMVISRPGGSDDVGYRMIARPLLERLDAVRGHVDLVVLRPPTLKHLEEVLSQARADGEPFQMVHFDGHGALAGQAGGDGWGPLTFHGPAPQGVLVFEKPGGGADPVPAAQVAAVLAGARVPVVVLNACQSGAVGGQVEAAVATRLLQEGAASVVAMAYSVYAVAAAEFMTAFYERLFAGDRVADAVTAGRLRLARRNGRPSPKGSLPLADWVVPVHYARREVRFPDLRTERTRLPSLDEMLDQLRESDHADGTDALAPVDRFVGRDGLFYTIEVAARLQHVVLVHGPGGTGKTELVKAFGRWWRETGGVERPEWVIWHSFEPGVASFGLDGLVAAIGTRVFGVDFARVESAERRRLVLALLMQRRLLLVLDNFESVHSMPDQTGATPPLDERQRDELREFLTRLAGGAASAVLITSRSQERWLGGGLRRVEVGGLSPNEAIEYAEELLAPFPHTRRRRAGRVFGELMRWLDGHPLSMRLVLPHLDNTEPQALLAALHGTRALPGEDDGGRTTSLPASVAYSFAHLDPVAQQALTAVSLFHGVVDADVLSVFSGAAGVPDRFAGHSAQDWAAMLDRAAGVGLLSRLGAGMYRIHPALPAYLAAHWRRHDPDAYPSERAAGERALLDAYAHFSQWLGQQILAGDAALAFTVIAAQQRTLGALLGYALDNRLWEQAQAIGQPLDEYWHVRGLHEEARGWVDRARLVLEAPDGAPPSFDTPAGALWLFLAGAQAGRDIEAGRHGQAEQTYQDIQQALQRQSDSPQQRARLAVVYHQLGMVVQDRRRLDDAEDWYRKSLAIQEELGNRPGMAASYHQLGVVAQVRGRLGDAEDWYRKSLAIQEELGNRPDMAGVYHQLGMVAQDRGRLDDAEDWYRKSLDIEVELGDRPGMASVYHQLGVVAQFRGRLGDAEDWYRRSLTIKEELGNRPGMVNSYHQLGMVAQFRGRLDEAEDWYRKSLTINGELGNRPGMASSYHQLGMVAQDRGRLDEAEDWYRKSLTINEEFGNRPGMASSYHQLGVIDQDRGLLDEAEDWYRKSLAIQEELGNRPGMTISFGQLGLLAEARHQRSEALTWMVRCVALFDEFPHPATRPGPEHLARLTAELGMDALERAWQQVTDHPLPQAVRDYLRNKETS